jgi:hypothetical protein
MVSYSQREMVGRLNSDLLILIGVIMTDVWNTIKDHVNEVSEVSALNLLLLPEEEAAIYRDRFVHTAAFLQEMIRNMTSAGYDDVEGYVVLEMMAAQVIALYKAAGVWDESNEPK